MNKVTLYLVCSYLLLTIGCKDKSFEKHAVSYTHDSVSIKITAISNSIFRIQKYKDGTQPENKSLVVEPDILNDSSPIENLNKKETDQKIILQTDSLKLTLSKENGLIQVEDHRDKLLLSEKAASIKPDTAHGNFFNIESTFQKNEEAFYGLGQHPEGYMNYQNKKVTLLQENTRTAVPFHLSTKGYGLLWDNYSKTTYDFTGKNYHITSNLGEQMDYYFIGGHTFDSIIRGYRELTGDAPMLPQWAFGYWQSRERYENQDQLLSVARKFREKNFPIDLIIQDWQYWGQHPWNAMVFDSAKFPNPAKATQILHDSLNMKFMIVVWPRLGGGSEAYRELKQNGFLMRDPDTSKVLKAGEWAQKGSMRKLVLSTYYDAHNPEARDKYWELMKTNLFDKINNDAWWIDSPEPLVHGTADYSTYQTSMGPVAYYRNTYPLLHTQGIYKGQRRTTSQKRVTLLTRSAFAGAQENSIIAWSGDIAGSWNVLKRQIAAGVNFSMSGIPYWTSDIGGFFIDDYENPNKSTEYNELYTRWFQFGAFCPVFRSHGTTAPREPWQFNENIQPILRKYLNLRYKLLPYIYSQAWQVTQNQSTIMRGLVMDFMSDSTVHSIKDQYMFGPSLMVCPVTEYKARKREVYLPKNRDWYDFYTEQKFKGGNHIDAEAPLEKMPLFVKSGSIIPMGPEVQYTKDRQLDTLDLKVYTGNDGDFIYYTDEGDNYNYEDGDYATTRIQWDDKNKKLSLSDRKGQFDGMTKTLVFRITIISDTELQKKIITYTGKKETVAF